MRSCSCRYSPLAARTWRGALHMRPVRTNFIARDLPTAHARRCDPPVTEHEFHRARVAHGMCARALRPTALVIVSRFTSRRPNLAWRAPHAPCEDELHHARVAHGMCEALQPTTTRDRADVHLGLRILAMNVHSFTWIKSAWIKKTMSSLP